MRERAYLDRNGSAALWFAFFGPPAAWFVAQCAGYFFVPWACSHKNTLPLHLIAAIATATVLLAGYIGFDIWRESGRRWSDDKANREDRSRFIAELGMAESLLFALILIGQWAGVGILGPCIPLPRIPHTPDAMLATGPLLLAHLGGPLGAHDLSSAWNADPFVLLPMIWAGVFYYGGLRAAPRRLRSRGVAFGAGCAALILALLSPLDRAAGLLFSAHMLQHTLLIIVAAPLIVIGRPVLVSLWYLPRARRKALAHQRAIRVLTRCVRFTPGQAFCLHAAAIWLWHAPALYQAALGSELIHALEHASFLLTAIAFWAAILDVRSRRASYGSGVLLVFGTAMHMSVLGALMTLAPVAWYPRYAATTQAWGLTLLEDQQIAGLIMWVPAGLLYTLAALFLLAAWMRESELRIRSPHWAASLVICAVVSLTACDRWPGVSLQAMNDETAASMTGGDPAVGQQTIRRLGCGSCHTIDGVRGARGLVGPPLNGIGKRVYIAGVLTNTPANMIRWIQDPQAVDSLTAMPKLGVSAAQARDIAAYLYTLR